MNKFQEGHIPWNKGIKGVMPVPWNKGKSFLCGSNNPNWKEKITKVCLICNKKFFVIPSRKNSAKFCSHKCSSKFKEKSASWNKGLKGYLSEKKHWNWKGGRIKTKDNYILILIPKHPFSNYHGYILEHRYCAEAYLSRFLNSKECVHHIDGNPENNLPENLYVFSSSSEHTKFDNRWYKIKLKSNLI